MSVEMLSSFPKELTAEVDTVVFDVVGTLLEPSPSVAKAYKNSAETLGVTLPEADISKRFSVAWEKQEFFDSLLENYSEEEINAVLSKHSNNQSNNIKYKRIT